MISSTPASVRSDFETWVRDHLSSTEPAASDLRRFPAKMALWLERQPINVERYKSPWTDTAWLGFCAAAARP